MKVLINGRDVIDETGFLDYIGDDIIDIEIAKHNIGRFIYLHTHTTMAKILPDTSFILETINDELYKRAFFMDNKTNINYIYILANRISTLLSLHGNTAHSMRMLIEFLYDQIR